jgi:hypothetical protein
VTRHLLPVLLATLVATPPLHADEFTEVLEEAIRSYETGDHDAVRADLDYAEILLDEMKAEGLAAHLPEAMPGWEKSEAQAEGIGAGIGRLAGGTSAAAAYSHPDGSLTISLVADSPVLASVSAVISRLATATGGRPLRIQEIEFVENGGRLQGMVENRILVTVSGDASFESKKAYLQALDLQALRDF